MHKYRAINVYFYCVEAYNVTCFLQKKCKHCFCRECAKKGGGSCPLCKEPKQEFEEALPRNLFICTHGGGRYDNKGCGNSYRSKRDLDAHVQFRHAPKAPAGQMLSIPQPTAPATSTAVPQFQMSHPGLQMYVVVFVCTYVHVLHVPNSVLFVSNYLSYVYLYMYLSTVELV